VHGDGDGDSVDELREEDEASRDEVAFKDSSLAQTSPCFIPFSTELSHPWRSEVTEAFHSSHKAVWTVCLCLCGEVMGDVRVRPITSCLACWV
jgi:hypothetical protein